MKVLLAKSAGFCYGVRRAVELAEQTAEETGGCWMLGDLIHNAHVVEDLARRGVRKAEDPSMVPAGGTVLIRSHGELQPVLDALTEQGACLVDATCPNVRRIHTLAVEAEAQGRQFILIGDPKHPEAEGIASRCKHPLVLERPKDVTHWLNKTSKKREISVTLAAQTTCIRELFETSCKIIKKECTNVKIFDTICNATQTRQTEAAAIAAQADVMVVVGDRKSANTKHLTEICQKSCPRVYQIENVDQLLAGLVQ